MDVDDCQLVGGTVHLNGHRMAAEAWPSPSQSPSEKHQRKTMKKYREHSQKRSQLQLWILRKMFMKSLKNSQTLMIRPLKIS